MPAAAIAEGDVEALVDELLGDLDAGLIDLLAADVAAGQQRVAATCRRAQNSRPRRATCSESRVRASTPRTPRSRPASWPDLRRSTSRQPVAANDPINKMDPLGLSAVKDDDLLTTLIETPRGCSSKFPTLGRQGL